MPDERHAIDGSKNGDVCFTVRTGNSMELAAHRHSCQNLFIETIDYFTTIPGER
jgi:hypothetical protein